MSRTGAFTPRSTRHGVTCVFLAIGGALGMACSAPATRPPDPSTPATPPFANRLWIATDPAAAPGSLRVFLADGTLMMTSCGETYRLVRWRSLDSRRVEWQEDTARIEAAVDMRAPDAMQMTLTLGRETKVESYRAAAAPQVCPDLRR